MNNFTDFTFDSYGKNTKIVETTAGTVTSTKQFVWACGDRKEERDGTGTLTKKFFVYGCVISGTKYFYSKDHLGSQRELTDNLGAIQVEYGFDPFGQSVKLSGILDADFSYASYYTHTLKPLSYAL